MRLPYFVASRLTFNLSPYVVPTFRVHVALKLVLGRFTSIRKDGRSLSLSDIRQLTRQIIRAMNTVKR